MGKKKKVKRPVAAPCEIDQPETAEEATEREQMMSVEEMMLMGAVK